MTFEGMPEGYGALLTDLKERIRSAQVRAALAVNRERAFAAAWTDEKIVQQAAAQIPWFHNCVLLDKVKQPEERKWYVGQTIAYGWSRSILEHQIETKLYQRQGKAITNFETTWRSI